MMKVLVSLFVGVFLCWQTSIANQYVFDFNENCQQAYHAILRLEIKEGQQKITAERKANPNNLIPYLLENYIDFFELFFNEDPQLYQKRLAEKQKRISLIEKGPSNHPYYLFSKAVINFQWATIRIKFGDSWHAGWEMRRSFLQIKECLSASPHFAPAQLYYGSMLTAISTIPDGYKWLGNLLGLKGDLVKGMQIIESFLKSNSTLATVYRNEAIFYYCYLQYHVLNKKQEVIQFIQEKQLDVVNNHLFNYLSANLYINNQQAAKAEQVLLKRKTNDQYLVSPVWDMQMGYALLYQLKPGAPIYFKNFVNQFKGKFYLKDILIKLSWWYYLQDDTKQSEYYRQKTLLDGNTETDADKQAQQYASNGVFPPKDLLKARLLSDGGLNSKALDLLKGKTYKNYSSIEHQLEFNYRVARICDELQMIDDAKLFYELTIQQGNKRKEYYAARSALQLGLLYEKEKNFVQAKNYFQTCMNMKNHQYKNSLDQRAKAGLERIKLMSK